MRIISKFQDYYDGVQMYGHDKDDLVFVRENHEYVFDYGKNEHIPYSTKELSSCGAPRNHDVSRSRFDRGEVLHVIGFCGKTYLLYEICGKFYTSIPEFFAAVDDDSAFGEKPCINFSWKENREYYKRLVEKARELDSRHKKHGWSWTNYRFSEAGWEKWKSQNESRLAISSEIFRNYKTPILMKTYDYRDKFIVNPCLKDINFQRVIDPYTAYQEIDMYLGNNMVDQFDPSANRTDDDIRDSHGMDKWSFRSPAPGRKKRKNKKKA